MLYPCSSNECRMLLITKNQSIVDGVRDAFDEENHLLMISSEDDEIIQMIQDIPFDIAIIDIVFLINTSPSILKDIKNADRELDIILITGERLVNVALEFTKNGAIDFITRPINKEHLRLVVHRGLERRELIRAARERDLYRRLSNVDNLTGLYNHRYFHEQINREIHLCKRKNSNFSIFLLDIDNFKKINDSYGHQVGDEVLRDISTGIAQSCREYDTVARYGGEEFGVILSDVSDETSKGIAGRIIDTISSIQYEGVDRSITLSIGISSFPIHSDKKDDLIRKADAALYYSKERGKNTYTLYMPECDNSLM